MATTWKLVYRAKDKGHRYFEELVDGVPSGRIGVADESGDDSRHGGIGTPDKTEDGVLYLDTSLPIIMGKRSGRIPLLRPNGEVTSTGEHAGAALGVVLRFKLQLQVGDDLFQLVPAST